jgi:hypothetical protein
LKNWPGARCRGLGQAPSASRWFKILNRGCYQGRRCCWDVLGGLRVCAGEFSLLRRYNTECTYMCTGSSVLWEKSNT